MTPERWKQIDELFGMALELEPEKRSAFLNQACADDEELRQQVEKLLSSDLQTKSYIEASPKLLAADLLIKPIKKVTSGTLLAERYKILSPLGAGGMGEVYRAKDLRLDRDVAVKILPEHLAIDPNAHSRFEREAKAIAALSHINILAIHDFGSDNDLSFAVMELLEGETLRQRLSRSHLLWPEVVTIAIAIADGLSAAHSKGVIHRDLKPENIFLTKDGQIKIVDFGLAQRRPIASTNDTATAANEFKLTQSGVVIGTVPYMSPEQVRGDPVDVRTDIFSYGSMLYEMLTGRRAFDRNTPAETIAAILQENPPSFSIVLPEELNQIIQHCMEKDPEKRFQTASDLIFALKSLQDRKPEIPGHRTLWITLLIILLAAVMLFLFKQLR